MPFRSRRLTRRTRAGQRERRLPAARVQRAWTWKQQEMTVSTLGYIGDSCIQLVSRTALALPMSTAIDPCPVMQRHAGQTQYDRGQRRHHEPVRSSAPRSRVFPSVYQQLCSLDFSLPPSSLHVLTHFSELAGRPSTDTAHVALEIALRYSIWIPSSPVARPLYAFNLLHAQHGQERGDVP